MRVCILQPSYIPWKGLFHQIACSDIFVFLDTVQYDKRGWRNRNQIKTPQGPSWLTIPVHAHGTHEGLPIKAVQVQDDQWAKHHLQKIKLNYQKSAVFEVEFSWIEELFTEAAKASTYISDITIQLTKAIAQRMGIQGTHFVNASDISVQSTNPSERLLKIVQALNGKSYLSGPSAKNYLDVEQFENAGLSVDWMRYDYPEYQQLYPPFTHQVSILDLILMTGAKDAGSYIWGTHKEAELKRKTI